KTGRLKVDYALAPGVFFIREGELVDAKVGALNGIDAVYFALTLPSASFDFNAGMVSSRHTITDKWASVVLEGLRRIDEGILPNMEAAFSGEDDLDEAFTAYLDCIPDEGQAKEAAKEGTNTESAMPFSMMVDSATSDEGNRKKMIAGVAAAVVVVCLIVAIPVTKRLTRADVPAAQTPAPAVPQQPSEGTNAAQTPAPAEGTEAVSTPKSEVKDAELAARREREAKLKAKREEEARKAATAKTVAASAPAGGAKSVRVSIAYDENGRVTQASAVGSSPGAEAYATTAIRIARGRRFPAGKAGSTVVTIPMN
ncbi:MAG: DUF4388 domain-containing protein, partial [Acidobacteria bacterium]|nr:DUF4388 domain-containing protein [Acidobacteriota bacterium]